MLTIKNLNMSLEWHSILEKKSHYFNVLELQNLKINFLFPFSYKNLPYPLQIDQGYRCATETYTLLKIKELFQLKVKIDPNTKKAMCGRIHPCSTDRVAWSSPEAADCIT